MLNFIQKISYSIRPYPRTQKKTGKNNFGLLLVINGDPRLLPIEISYFTSEFDTVKQCFIYNGKNDNVIRDLNLTIARELGRANDIVTRYRLTSRILTHKAFKQEFSNYTSRDNAHDYFITKAKLMLNDGQTVTHTYHNYLSTFARLKAFHKNELPFIELTTGFLVRFDNHLRKIYKHNTIVGTHKTINKFLRLAVEDGLLQQSPYNNNKQLKISYKDGERTPLEPNELEMLIDLFKEKSKLSDLELNVLEMFVFSATSGGYRFSELQILNSSDIKFGVLKMETVKGKKAGVELNIDLPEIGLSIVAGRKGKIFGKVTEPAANRALKKLVSMAGIRKHITFHSARDTFGTLYVYYGGDITTLSKDIFKHASLNTTMIYQKKSTAMKRKDMNNFNVFSLPK